LCGFCALIKYTGVFVFYKEAESLTDADISVTLKAQATPATTNGSLLPCLL